MQNLSATEKTIEAYSQALGLNQNQTQNTTNDEGFIFLFAGIEDEENSSIATDSEPQPENEDGEANSQLTPHSQVSQTTSYTTDNDETMRIDGLDSRRDHQFQRNVEHENEHYSDPNGDEEMQNEEIQCLTDSQPFCGMRILILMINTMIR